MRRLLGTALIIIAVISLLIGAIGLIGIWTLRQPVSDATVTAVNLFIETLDTTSDTLKVTSDSLQSANEMADTAERTSLSVAQTLSTTRTTIGSFAAIMGKDLPASINSARTALQSAQASAVVVDGVLGTLARLPFSGVQYNPAVPLNVALGDVAKSLDSLPPTFATIERNLNGTSEGLDQVVKSLNDLPRTTQATRQNVASAQRAVARYQSEVDNLKKMIAPLRTSLDTVFTAIALGLSFVILWLFAMQLLVLREGLRLFRDDGNGRIL